jgi:DNA-binding NarL/FixJ family response regulator
MRPGGSTHEPAKTPRPSLRLGRLEPVTSHQLRIAIVEDEDLFRDLLGLALERHERFLVVGSFSNAPEALARIPNLEPDLVMLDIDLGGSMNGVELGMALQKHIPNLGVVLLSNHQDLEFVAGLGAEVQRWSYLLKKSVRDLKVLVRALEGTADGLVVLDPHLVASMKPQRGVLSTLTARQLDVLRLIAQGYSNSGIAESLGIAAKTVDNLTNVIYQTLDVVSHSASHARVKAVLAYLEAVRSG